MKNRISDLSIGQSFAVSGSVWIAREWRANGSLEAEPISGKAFETLEKSREMNLRYNSGRGFIPHKIFAAFAANRTVNING